MIDTFAGFWLLYHLLHSTRRMYSCLMQISQPLPSSSMIRNSSPSLKVLLELLMALTSTAAHQQWSEMDAEIGKVVSHKTALHAALSTCDSFTWSVGGKDLPLMGHYF
jgi:hypothetical protein